MNFHIFETVFLPLTKQHLKRCGAFQLQPNTFFVAFEKICALGHSVHALLCTSVRGFEPVLPLFFMDNLLTNSVHW